MTLVGVLETLQLPSYIRRKEIGIALYEYPNYSGEKVEFVFLLKTYRKLFEHCTPIMVTMQKTTIDAIQLSSMIKDFKRVLANFDFERIWDRTVASFDPEFPTVCNRGGWIAMEQGNDGSQESWKCSLSELGGAIVAEFTEQLNWRFANLSRFLWINLVHPTKFEERRRPLYGSKDR